MPTLTPSEFMTLAGMAVTAISAFVAVREQVKAIKGDLSEVMRLVAAVHKRMDKQDENISALRTNHAVLEERVSNLRTTQRFKLRTADGIADLMADEG